MTQNIRNGKQSYLMSMALRSGVWLPLLIGFTGQSLAQPSTAPTSLVWPINKSEADRFAIPSQIFDRCLQPHEVSFTPGGDSQAEPHVAGCFEGPLAPMRHPSPLQVTVKSVGASETVAREDAQSGDSHIPPCCNEAYQDGAETQRAFVAHAALDYDKEEILHAIEAQPLYSHAKTAPPQASSHLHTSSAHCGGTHDLHCAAAALVTHPLEALCSACPSVIVPAATSKCHCSQAFCGGTHEVNCGAIALADEPLLAVRTAPPFPLPEDPKPFVPAAPVKPVKVQLASVAAEVAGSRSPRSRSRSTDALRPAAEGGQTLTVTEPVRPAQPEVPLPPAPTPPTIPPLATPMAISPSPQATSTPQLADNPARYPLYETEPESFIAQESAATTLGRGQGLPGAPPVDSPGQTGSQGYLINFQNLAMTEILKFVGQLTGKNFIYNSDDVQFTVSIVSKEPTSLENIMAALLQELRIHNLAITEQGNNLIIHKQAGPLAPSGLFSGETHQPQEIGTRVFRINHISADRVSEIVGRMLSEQALVQVLSDANTLIITDLAINVERINDLIKVLDVPQQTYEVGQYVATNALITDLIPLAERILEPLSSGKPPLLVASPTTNSVFVVGSHEIVNQAFTVLRKLDGREGATEILTLEDLRKGSGGRNREPSRLTPEEEALRNSLGGASGAGGVGEGERVQPRVTPATLSELHTRFWIHKLQYRQGDQLTDALYRIADSLRLDEKANLDLINAINSVQWLESSNSIVITGTEEAVGRVKELVEELDVALRQVFLEMLILDTTVSDSLRYSVDVADRFQSQFVGSAEGFNQPVTTSALLPVAQNQVNITSGLVNANSLANTEGFNLGIIGRKIFRDGAAFTTIGALVQALHTDITEDIVLNPKILVEDGFPAEVFVGQNTAFQTQAIANDNGNILTQNVEFRDVGTSLKVTPQLGNGNMVTLLIEQEVSSVVTTTTGTNGTSSTGSALPVVGPTTSKSSTITKVHIPDGYFVILSGVIRDDKRKVRRQMPCLGGVPVIGAFFANQENTIEKRNLLVFIRPVIVDQDWEYDELTRRQQNIFNEKRKRKPRWKYEADEALEFLNLPPFNDCRNPDRPYYYSGSE